MYMENYKRNALGPTVRQTTWKTSIGEHHKRNGDENTQKKQIGKPQAKRFRDNSQANYMENIH